MNTASNYVRGEMLFRNRNSDSFSLKHKRTIPVYGIQEFYGSIINYYY